METFPRHWPYVRGIHLSPVDSPSHWPVARNCDIFFDLCLNKQLNKHSRSWWFETPPHSLWRHCNNNIYIYICPSSLYLSQVVSCYRPISFDILIWLVQCFWSTRIWDTFDTSVITIYYCFCVLQTKENHVNGSVILRFPQLSWHGVQTKGLYSHPLDWWRLL